MSNQNPKHSTPFLEKIQNVLRSLFRKFNKMFDRIIFNKVGSLIVSFLISLVICLGINYDNIRVELFNDRTTIVDLGNIDVDIQLDEENFEVSGVPSSVQVSLSGEAMDIQVFRQQNPNLKVEADLRQYDEGSHVIELELKNLPSTLKSIISPETVTATITKKQTRSFTVSPEIVIGTGQKSSDFKTPVLSQNMVTVRATADELNAIRFVRAIVDVSGHTNEEKKFEVKASVACYDADGSRVQVEIEPDKIDATVEREDTE